MPEVRWTRNALGHTLELGARNRERIVSQVRHLREFPDMGIELRGPYEGKRRLLAGPYSVVYEHDREAGEVRVLFVVYGGLS